MLRISEVTGATKIRPTAETRLSANEISGESYEVAKMHEEP